MYAIVTSYRGPTSARGSCMNATAAPDSRGKPRRASIPYGQERDSDAEHVAARNAWIKKHCADPLHVFNSPRIRWTEGALPNGDTVHVAQLI
jgi:hypothetical protein